MSEETTKQDSITPPELRNPNGKGGFGDNPQNRNNGAWKKVDTFRYWYDTFKEMSVSELKRWQKANPEEDRKVVADLAFNAVIRASGDLKYLVEVTDRTEGKAQQKVEHSGGMEIQVLRLENLIDGLLDEEDTEDSENN